MRPPAGRHRDSEPTTAVLPRRRWHTAGPPSGPAMRAENCRRVMREIERGGPCSAAGLAPLDLLQDHHRRGTNRRKRFGVGGQTRPTHPQAHRRRPCRRATLTPAAAYGHGSRPHALPLNAPVRLVQIRPVLPGRERAPGFARAQASAPLTSIASVGMSRRALLGVCASPRGSPRGAADCCSQRWCLQPSGPS